MWKEREVRGGVYFVLIFPLPHVGPVLPVPAPSPLPSAILSVKATVPSPSSAPSPIPSPSHTPQATASMSPVQPNDSSKANHSSGGLSDSSLIPPGQHISLAPAHPPSSVVMVKLVQGDNIHTQQLELQETIESFRKKMKELFGGEVIVKYMDEEGDPVIVGYTHNVQHVIKLAQKKTDALLWLTVSTAATSSSSSSFSSSSGTLQSVSVSSPSPCTPSSHSGQSLPPPPQMPPPPIPLSSLSLDEVTIPSAQSSIFSITIFEL